MRSGMFFYEQGYEEKKPERMGWAKTLCIEALHAEAKQERRKAGNAVNPRGLMLKRFQQAKTVHGINPQMAPPNEPDRIRKKVQAIVPNRFSGGASSSGLGSSTDGTNATFREGQKHDTESDGHCKE